MASILISYLQLVRAPAVFTACSNILAAYLIAQQGAMEWGNLIFLMLASSALYSAGMVLNDCFDYEEDCRDRPSRPLPSQRIALSSAWRLGWLLMSGGLLFAGLVGYRQLMVALILAVMIVVYDAYAKQFLFGILVMAGCRYLNWLLGLSIVGFEPIHFMLALPVFIYVCSLTLLSRVETSADRKHYVALSLAGFLLAALVMLFLQLTTPASPWLAPLILLALSVSIAGRLFKTYRDFSPSQIQASMKFLIMGIIPLDALLVLSHGYFGQAAVILSLLLPGWLLGRSMRVT